MPPDPIPLRRRAAAHGLTLLAVVPVPAEGGAWEPADPAFGSELVAEGDLAALVAPAPAPGADAAPEHVTARHWEVHRALLRGDVAPAPVGIVFDSADAVRAFLAESHAALHGALDRVAGRWEFRLHVGVTEQGLARQMALDLSTHIYAELRRISAGAMTLAPAAGGVLSAAFLVERSGSAAFQDRAEVLGHLNGALALDLTGPWPAYDFVHMHAVTTSA